MEFWANFGCPAISAERKFNSTSHVPAYVGTSKWFLQKNTVSERRILGESKTHLPDNEMKKQYLLVVPTVRISQGALEGEYFRHQLDGMRHNWIPAKEADHCQFCYYHLMNNVAEEDRRHFTKSLKQNCSRIQRCLVCHVNLCPQCDNIFHGSDLSTFTRCSMP